MTESTECSASVLRTARNFVAGFERVQRERMVGLPILHPGLSVAVIGAQEWHLGWLGMLLTPWCMNLVLVPGERSAFVPGRVGSKQVVSFPAGEFEFIASEEEGIGAFAACSMFSPMQTFADQPSAIATAEAIMAALFEPASAADGLRPRQLACARPGMSRRDLLRGRFSRP